MEINKRTEKLQNWIKKYKYAVLVLIIGLALMLMPNNQSRQQKTDAVKKKLWQKT